MLRFILELALVQLASDLATLLAMVSAAMRWPLELLLDLVGAGC